LRGIDRKRAFIVAALFVVAWLGYAVSNVLPPKEVWLTEASLARPRIGSVNHRWMSVHKSPGMEDTDLMVTDIKRGGNGGVCDVRVYVSRRYREGECGRMWAWMTSRVSRAVYRSEGEMREWGGRKWVLLHRED
jgi:hypothetical protein